MKRAFCLLSLVLCAVSGRAADADSAGYYRFPAVHGDFIVFTAEGDLWRVGIHGGVAERLTSHPGQEAYAAVSPDGRTVAFSAEYEGPTEVYTMPVTGGLPARLTFDGAFAQVAGWTPDGKVLYATRKFSTLPDMQLAVVEPKTGLVSRLPLNQASDGVFTPDGKTIYFTRMAFQGSSTKRYKGGTAQNLWKYTLGADEAIPLTADFPGTSKNPMWWRDRVYFVSDRDGVMNLWSMKPDGTDLRQSTHHKSFDVKGASLSEGRIVYQIGADLRLYTIDANLDEAVPITIVSDFDQEREKWVKKPVEYLTTANLSPDGDRIVLTARGEIFVAPVGAGRFVQVTHGAKIRYRQADFMPDGKSLLALSDATGELEFEQLPANGIGSPQTLTHDGKIFRSSGVPSPDGKWIAFQDKNLELWVFNLAEKKDTRIATSHADGFSGIRWSPDSQWLAYVSTAANLNNEIFLYRTKDGSTTALTSDRVNCDSPAWSPDGKWIYFLSDRHFKSVVSSVWGVREPEPFFNNTDGIYMVSLTKDGRSPFEPNDELHPGDKDKPAKEAAGESKTDKKKSKADKAKSDAKKDDTKKDEAKKAESKPEEKDKTPVVNIDLEGIQTRVQEVPVPPGNYANLTAGEKQLYWIARHIDSESKPTLMTLSINNDDPKPKTLAEDATNYQLSLDGKKLLFRKGEEYYVVDSGIPAPAKLEKSVDLKGWTFSIDPRDERRQMFVESWRLMRDFFYDPNMHGVDWPAIRKKYEPLAARVRDRLDLSDLIADMVGELSALHTFVRGGDFRPVPDEVKPAALGAALTRDTAAGGDRISHIYEADPDYPDRLSPLAHPGLNLKNGDVIESVNGTPVLSVPSIGALLRNQAGRQVLLGVKTAGAKESREVIVTPMAGDAEAGLRYDDWELSHRRQVEQLGGGDLGYVHLRAMGSGDIATWARDFYPVFNRKGLIVDVRHNGGGNIDSWILEKLMRKAWFFWQTRAGDPTWNMQYAFRGHMVVLCDERTGSDGEAFTEGFRRLGLGKVIGTRTWGGEIWLSMDNTLVDAGIASAAEDGVYGPEGKWLIEGHGVDPDMVVDNLPHATFNGEDAQLKAAIKELKEEIRLQPVTVPPAPKHPDKSFK